MKKRFSKRSACVTLGLLLIGLSLSCYVWVRREQRQYVLNRQLIAALWKKDTKQALVLVEAGADPNTREEPAPVPSLSLLIRKFLYSSPSRASSSATAFLIVCGSRLADKEGSYITSTSAVPSPDPRLTQAMLVHDANVHAKDRYGLTALHNRVMYALNDRPTAYGTDIEIITQLLDSGADPDEEAKDYMGFFGETPLKTALAAAALDAPPHPDLVALLCKYRKHP